MQPKDMSVVSMVDIVDEDLFISPIKETLCFEALATIIMNFYSYGTDEYDEIVRTLISIGSYPYAWKKLDFNLKNRVTLAIHLCIELPPILELKALSPYTRYTFLWAKNTLLFIIVFNLASAQVESFISILKRFKQANSWTIADIASFSLRICTHNI